MSSHANKVKEQFGPLANAYLSSAVHSQGADLVAMAEKFRNASSAAVLDLGCGAGHLSYAIAPHVKSTIAYDLSPEMLEVVGREAERRNLGNITTKQGYAEELPFEGASFDWVCTRYSAHHWTDVRRTVGEIRRVLKPGGTLIVIDTFAPASPLLDTHLQTIELLRDGSHVRNYTLAEWNAMLEAQGFQVKVQNLWRLRLDFQAWIGRMNAPPVYVDAIRSLLQNAPAEVRSHYEVKEDGSFTLDSMFIEAD